METTRNIKIVVLDDDLYFNKVLTKEVQKICNQRLYPQFRFEVRSFLNARDYQQQSDGTENILLLDYYLSPEDSYHGLTGADILKEVKTKNPECKVIMVSGLQQQYMMNEMLDEGVFDYIEKSDSTRQQIENILQRIMLIEA